MAQPAERKTMLTPTRNRFVNFTPPAPDKDPVLKSHGNLPFSALITHVWGPKMVNLVVFMPNGDIKPYTSVTLLDGTETEKEMVAYKKNGRYAEWPVIAKTEIKVELVAAGGTELAKQIQEQVAKAAASMTKPDPTTLGSTDIVTVAADQIVK
jgi:hypothetical protein